MKHITLLLLTTISILATDYYGIIGSIAQDEVDKFRQEFSYYNEYVLDTSAAMVAMSNVDFNPNYQGFSAGIGFATIDSEYGRGKGYAVGMQYVYESLAINVKGSRNGGGDYILGTGLVVGF